MTIDIRPDTASSRTSTRAGADHVLPLLSADDADLERGRQEAKTALAREFDKLRRGGERHG